MNPGAVPADSGYFYRFLGAHSLLIGLLPFFLPVFLWQHGLDLAGLALLIGVSGVGFVAALGSWQRLAVRMPLRVLISLSFVLEFGLILVVGLLTQVPGAPLFSKPGMAPDISMPEMVLAASAIGVANGLYNAFFWTTQRTLFLQQLDGNDTGRHYGNFQIFVTLFLKAGILLGGVLLEFGGFIWLLAISAGVGVVSTTQLAMRAGNRPAMRQNAVLFRDAGEGVTLLGSLTTADRRGSRPVFIVDGLFLYLESHFWTLTLFLVVRQDYSRLGVAVVLLALVFAALFYLIKNRIDQLPVERVYIAAVWLYASSWLLRFTLDSESSGASLWFALILITFCSSFFRLAFNKRFFDVARQAGSVHYLLVKSYSSQAWLGFIFIPLAALLLFIPFPQDQFLQYLYLPAALLSAIYWRYSSQG
ncbi:MAG: hypothetical protein HKN42_04385 [Granulosicoccus sp.]|nr:hypothetical protein [Granulosicoccus sp.]